jgi:16S rRNA (cytosine967-C5)-methyltransferase
MTKRRSPAPNQTGPGQSRRHTLRRTPQDNVRSAAGWVLERTLRSLSPVESFLDSALSRFDDRDQGLLNELVMGTLRWLRRIDYVIARASNRRLDQIEEALHAPLRIGAYQLLFLDRVPHHAAVHEAVEQAHQLTHRGGASFVNGVLRAIARAPRLEDWPVEEADPVRRLALELSHPDFLVARWMERFGEERTLELLTANNRAKPMQILAFRDRGGRELLAEQLIDEGIEVEPSNLSSLGLIVRRGNPLTSAAFARGDFYIQDEASQAAALIPPPRAGETILDAAAAPGGKSFSLIAHEPGVKMTAADVSLPRILTLRSNLRRLRRAFPLVVADAGAPPFDPSNRCFDRRFDRVILDLPCTGTGTLRRHPELKWRISESEIGRLTRQALRLMTGAAPLVESGGLLLAITCSLEKEENEDVMSRFLATHPDFARMQLEDVLETPLASGISGPGTWRVLTGADHDGFSVGVLAKARI